jgi:hypothetical protein
MTETNRYFIASDFQLLENAIRNAKEKQKCPELNATHQRPLVYADINSLS